MRNSLAPEHVNKLFNPSKEQKLRTAYMCAFAIIIATVAILCSLFSCSIPGSINRSDSIHIIKVYLPDIPQTKTPKDTIG